MKYLTEIPKEKNNSQDNINTIFSVIISLNNLHTDLMNELKNYNGNRKKISQIFKEKVKIFL